jgi:hypothetical protein
VEKNLAKKNKTLVTDRAADVGRMLPTVEPMRAQPRSAAAPEAFTPLKSQAFTPSQQTPQQPLQTEEILGNTVDPCWRFSAQTVPTRSSLTMPDGLPFGFVIQPFAAPEDSTRSGSPAAAAVRARRSPCACPRVRAGADEQWCGGRWLRRAAERCQGCGAFRNLYVAVEAATGRWMCNFCGHVQVSDDLKGKAAIEACREMRDAVVRLRAAPQHLLSAPCLHAALRGWARMVEGVSRVGDATRGCLPTWRARARGSG